MAVAPPRSVSRRPVRLVELIGWDVGDGCPVVDRRSKVEIVADDIAPSLKWATAEITRNERRDGGGGGFQGGGGGGGRPVANEPPAYDPNEEPF